MKRWDSVGNIKRYVLGEDFCKLLEELRRTCQKFFSEKYKEYLEYGEGNEWDFLVKEDKRSTKRSIILAFQAAVDLEEDALAIQYCLLNPYYRKFLKRYIKLVELDVGRIKWLMKISD